MPWCRPTLRLTVQVARIACLGREVRLADGGLPANVTAGTHEVLSAPARLVVETAAGPIAFHAEPSTFNKIGPGRVQWQSRSTAADATLACEGAMEFDGFLHYSMTFSATAAADLQDVRLELPFREESAGYMMGAGLLGGAGPRNIAGCGTARSTVSGWAAQTPGCNASCWAAHTTGRC